MLTVRRGAAIFLSNVSFEGVSRQAIDAFVNSLRLSVKLSLIEIDDLGSIRCAHLIRADGNY